MKHPGREREGEREVHTLIRLFLRTLVVIRKDARQLLSAKKVYVNRFTVGSVLLVNSKSTSLLLDKAIPL